MMHLFGRAKGSAGGDDTLGNTKYLHHDPRSAGKQESAARERRELLQADAMNQRVGMPVHLPPLRSVTAKDPGHAQRPVLIWQPANFAMLSFDHHQDYY